MEVSARFIFLHERITYINSFDKDPQNVYFVTEQDILLMEK